MRQFGNSTVIYTKNGCPYCVEAKRVLTERGYTFTEILIDGVTNTKASMCKDLGRELGTVPQIVLEGTFIPGGCAGLKKTLLG
jgi:glutaredoxin 3